MTQKISILLFLISSISFINAQEKISEELRKTYSKIFYANKEPIFGVEEFQYKTEKFLKSDFLEAPTAKLIDELIYTIKNTGKFNIKNIFNEKKLSFKAELSSDTDFKVTNNITLISNKSNLVYKNGEKIELKNESRASLKYKQLQLMLRPAKTLDSLQSISGNVLFDIEYVAKYNQVRLSKSNISEVFRIGDCKFKLIDVENNRIVVENLCGNKSDLEVINLTSNQDIIKSYSYMELVKLKKTNDSINLEGAFTKRNINLYKVVYNIFAENPKITQEEFDKHMTIELMEGLKGSTQYLIIKNVADFDAEFILYNPVFSRKQFTIEYK